MDRRSAQERIARMQAFAAELAELEHDGVLRLTDDQRTAVETHRAALSRSLEQEFDVDTTAGAEKLSIAMRIASALGALALSLALFFFVEQFWGRLPLPAQIGLMAAAPLLAVSLAEFASRHERTLYITSVLCAIAIAAFVLNLSQLPNLLGLRSSPVSFALLATISLLLADRYRLRLPLFFGIVFAVTFAAMAPRWLGGYSWESVYDRPELLIIPGIAAGWISLKQRADFAPVYRAVSALTLLVSLLSLSNSGGLSFVPVDTRLIEAFYTIAGLGLAAAGISLGIRRQRPEVTIIASAGFAMLMLSKMYDWLWDAVPPYVFFVLIGALSIGLITAFRHLRLRLKERLA